MFNLSGPGRTGPLLKKSPFVSRARARIARAIKKINTPFMLFKKFLMPRAEVRAPSTDL